MTALSLRQLVAAVSDSLTGAGYTRGEPPSTPKLSRAELRLFEDPYGIVGVAGFERCSHLLEDWDEVQGRVANAIADRLGRDEPKAWDGYLVLLTPEVPPPDAERSVMKIQYDTSLLRKFVSTGASAKTIADIDRLLAPLLPIRVGVDRKSGGNLLDSVPDLLGSVGLEPSMGEAVIQAFVHEESVPVTVHRYMWPDED